MPTPEIERPRPRWRTRITWKWRNTHQDAWVTASYAADTQDEDGLPNNITVTVGQDEFRLTREGADKLANVLNEALGWNGQ